MQRYQLLLTLGTHPNETPGESELFQSTDNLIHLTV